jgi:uncharacterized protein (TIGR02611 family)
LNPDIANREAAAELDEVVAAGQGEVAAGQDDGAPLRHPFRQFFARHRTLDLTYRIVVAAIGTAVVIGGIALIPLPGPGWLIVFGGLAILATEFEWAGRLLDFARRKVRGWTHWVGRQSLLVRGLIGLVGLLFVGGLMWAYVAVQGVPTWLPLL